MSAEVRPDSQQGPANGPHNDPVDFPEIQSSLMASLAERRLEELDPEVALEGERRFVEEMLERLARDTRSGAASRRYVRGDEVGRGGMGAVYKVLDRDLRRTLAMKVAIPRRGAPADDLALVSRFLEEAQVTGQLDHPGIVPLHDVGMDPKGRVYFTMRMVKGRHLGEVFARARRGEDGWSVERAVGALVRVCEAMAYAHDKGVIHRDLKPANVMAGRFGEVYVMDWGLCKVLGRKDRLEGDTSASLSFVASDRVDDDSLRTEFGRTMGTPAYMSPEQGRGNWDAVDHRSDVYSVGALLYELLTGRAPYVPEGARIAPHTVLQWLLERAPRPPGELAPAASPDLCAVCEKAMAREPEARYATMLELADDLRRFLAGRTVTALRLGPLGRVRRWIHRNPRVSALLVATVLGSAVAVTSLARLPRELVRAAAIDDARDKTELLTQVNALYTASVVERVDREHVRVTHDYAETPGAIPIPATLLTELADKITAEQDGLQVRHYSDTPFRFRGRRPLDSFGVEALAALRHDPTTPFHRFESVDGRMSLRFAVPRVMAASCVECHNSHPESTRTDWGVGDVRGVLEVIRPIDHDEERMRAGLGSAFLLSGSIFVALLGLAVVLLVRARVSHGEGVRN